MADLGTHSTDDVVAMIGELLMRMGAKDATLFSTDVSTGVVAEVDTDEYCFCYQIDKELRFAILMRNRRYLLVCHEALEILQTLSSFVDKQISIIEPNNRAIYFNTTILRSVV